MHCPVIVGLIFQITISPYALESISALLLCFFLDSFGHCYLQEVVGQCIADGRCSSTSLVSVSGEMQLTKTCRTPFMDT